MNELLPEPDSAKEIVDAFESVVGEVKKNGGSIDYQAKAFLQIASGYLDMLGRTGNIEAARLSSVLWNGLLEKA